MGRIGVEKLNDSKVEAVDSVPDWIPGGLAFLIAFTGARTLSFFLLPLFFFPFPSSLFLADTLLVWTLTAEKVETDFAMRELERLDDASVSFCLPLPFSLRSPDEKEADFNIVRT